MSKHKVNWVRLPDPLPQNEVNLEINWTADASISAALERQAKLMGFPLRPITCTSSLPRPLPATKRTPF